MDSMMLEPFSVWPEQGFLVKLELGLAGVAVPVGPVSRGASELPERLVAYLAYLACLMAEMPPELGCDLERLGYTSSETCDFAK